MLVALDEDPSVILLTNLDDMSGEEVDIGAAVDIVFQEVEGNWSLAQVPEEGVVSPMTKKGPQVAVVGAAYSTVSRRSELPLGVLATEAVRSAAAEAGIAVSEIDGLAVYPSPSRIGSSFTEGIDFVGAHYMQRALDLPSPSWSVQVNPGSFAGSVIEAADAVSAVRVDIRSCGEQWITLAAGSVLMALLMPLVQISS